MAFGCQMPLQTGSAYVAYSCLSIHSAYANVKEKASGLQQRSTCQVFVSAEPHAPMEKDLMVVQQQPVHILEPDINLSRRVFERDHATTVSQYMEYGIKSEQLCVRVVLGCTVRKAHPRQIRQERP